MQNYNKQLPSWAGLLLFDIVAVALIGLNMYQIVVSWGQTGSEFGFMVWIPFISGLLALVGVTHYFYIKRHMRTSTKRTVFQIISLICILPFLLLVLLFIYSTFQGGLIARQ